MDIDFSDMIKRTDIPNYLFVISNQRRLLRKKIFQRKNTFFLYITLFLRLYTYKSYQSGSEISKCEKKKKEIK